MQRVRRRLLAASATVVGSIVAIGSVTHLSSSSSSSSSPSSSSFRPPLGTYNNHVMGDTTTNALPQLRHTHSTPNLANSKIADAELKLLETHVKSRTERRLVHLPQSGVHLNTLIVRGNDQHQQGKEQENTEDIKDADPQQRKPVMVLAHGWGAGWGLFVQNIDALAAECDTLYMFDWHGMGASSRTPHTPQDVEEAEAFFLDPLREWMEVMGLHDRPIVLAGHSLGAYLTAAFTLQHPHRVSKLILVSPVGVPEAPPEEESILRRGNLAQRTLLRVFRYFWSGGWTPQKLMRALPEPLGKKMAAAYMHNRFVAESLTDEDLETFTEYFYRISVAEGSGEYAINTILQPGAFARNPLINRLTDLETPVVFIYGSNDWMDYRRGQECIDRMMKSKFKKLLIVERAGHQLYMEKPSGFNKTMLTALKMDGDEVEVVSITENDDGSFDVSSEEELTEENKEDVLELLLDDNRDLHEEEEKEKRSRLQTEMRPSQPI